MMTRKTLTAFTFLCFSTAAIAQQKDEPAGLINRPADVGLIYPLSTNGSQAAQYRNAFSLQAISGVSGAINGCAIVGIADIIKEDANGAVFAGIANIIRNNAKGAQIAGILNSVKYETVGFQAGGILNKAGNVKGVQVAGLANLTSGESDGLQVAGLFNKAENATIQIAGLVNRAKKVSGIQIAGLINIADSSDNPIGFINIIKNGEKNIGISTDETLNTLLTFRSGGRFLYGILGGGYNLKSDYHLYSLETGIGAHLIPINELFRINTEATQVVLADFKGDYAFKYSLRVVPEVKIAHRLEFFAGPSVNLLLDYSHGKIPMLVDHYLWTTTRHNKQSIGSYIGVMGGMKIIL